MDQPCLSASERWRAIVQARAAQMDAAYARLGRTWGFFEPLDQLRTDERDNGRELPLAAAGLVCFYALAAASVVGVGILRRRRVPVFVVVAPVVTVTIAVVLTYGQTRFRAPAEVSLAILAAVAVDAALTRLRRSGAAGAVTAGAHDRESSRTLAGSGTAARAGSAG